MLAAQVLMPNADVNLGDHVVPPSPAAVALCALLTVGLQDGRTVLHLAAYYGFADMVGVLLADARTDVNARDSTANHHVRNSEPNLDDI